MYRLGGLPPSFDSVIAGLAPTAWLERSIGGEWLLHLAAWVAAIAATALVLTILAVDMSVQL
jgi:hypothetical protein